MSEQACWTIIERAREGSNDFEQTAARVLELLRASSDEEIAAFERGRWQLMGRSYSWELWGAAYLVNGGCSDDGFDYFRGWLLSQGRERFEAALANPDSLADIVDDEVECEEILYAAYQAYSERGHERFEDGEEMQRRYPRLWAKFGWDGEGGGDSDDDSDED